MATTPIREQLGAARIMRSTPTPSQLQYGAPVTTNANISRASFNGVGVAPSQAASQAQVPVTRYAPTRTQQQERASAASMGTPVRYAAQPSAPSYQPAVIRTAEGLQQAVSSDAAFGGRERMVVREAVPERKVFRQDSAGVLSPDGYPPVTLSRHSPVAPTSAVTPGQPTIVPARKAPGSPLPQPGRVTLQAKIVPEEGSRVPAPIDSSKQARLPTQSVAELRRLRPEHVSTSTRIEQKPVSSEPSFVSKGEMDLVRRRNEDLEARIKELETRSRQQDDFARENESRMRKYRSETEMAEAQRREIEEKYAALLEEMTEIQNSKAGASDTLTAEVRSLRAQLETKEILASASETLQAEILSLRAQLESNAVSAATSDKLQAENLALRAKLDSNAVSARVSEKLEAEILSLRAQLESNAVSVSQAAALELSDAKRRILELEMRLKESQLKESMPSRQNEAVPASPPSSPSRLSPTKSSMEMERLQARCIDVEAQLLDANEGRKQLQAALVQKDEQIAKMQRQVQQAQEEARFVPEPSSPDGKKRIMDKVLDWLPKLHAPRSSVRRSSNADAALLLFQAAKENDVTALREALTSFPESADPVDLVLHTRNELKQTLLHVALGNGATEVASFILDQGQLYANQRKYYFELIGELLEREATGFVNSLDLEGRSPLAMLCTQKEAEKAHFMIAQSLMESSANPVQRDYSGCTPFLECTRSGNVGLMRMLLDITRGDVMYDCDDSNRMALHYGSEAGQKTTVELLLKVKADPESGDIKGQTSRELAEAAGHEEVLQLLLEGVKDSDDEDEEEEREADGNEDQSKKKKGGVSFGGFAAEEGDGEDDEGDDYKEFLKRARDVGMKRPDMPEGDFVPQDGETDEQGQSSNGHLSSGPSRISPGGDLRPGGLPVGASEDGRTDDMMGEGFEITPDMMGEMVMTPIGPCLVTPEGLIPAQELGMMGQMMGGMMDPGGPDELGQGMMMGPNGELLMPDGTPIDMGTDDPGMIPGMMNDPRFQR